MTDQIALVLNGPSAWYINLFEKYKKHGSTWLQQNRLLNRKCQDALQRNISSSGHFIALGYIQSPTKAIGYVFSIDFIASSNRQRIAPPDRSAPDFDGTYDVEQGKCSNSDDYKYVLWLRVCNMQEINPLEPSTLVSYNSGRPFQIAQAPHFYVYLPIELHDALVRRSGPLEKPPLLGVSDLEGVKTEVTRHSSRRSQRLRDIALKEADGVCCICDRNFTKLLGGLGVRVLQVHHRKQLSTLEVPTVNSAEDLAVVCANCHMLLHLNSASAIPVNDLRKMLVSDGGYEKLSS